MPAMVRTKSVANRLQLVGRFSESQSHRMERSDNLSIGICGQGGIQSPGAAYRLPECAEVVRSAGTDGAIERAQEMFAVVSSSVGVKSVSNVPARLTDLARTRSGRRKPCSAYSLDEPALARNGTKQKGAIIIRVSGVRVPPPVLPPDGDAAHDGRAKIS